MRSKEFIGLIFLVLSLVAYATDQDGHFFAFLVIANVYFAQA